jgi:hypothetical protein
MALAGNGQAGRGSEGTDVEQIFVGHRSSFGSQVA